MKMIGRCMTCKETKNCFVTETRLSKRTGSYVHYLRCNECHAKFMKPLMRKRYATPEGRAANLAATKKWYEKKLERINANTV